MENTFLNRHECVFLPLRFTCPVSWTCFPLLPVTSCTELCAQLFFSSTKKKKKTRPSQPCNGGPRPTSDHSAWFVLPGNGLQNVRMQKKTNLESIQPSIKALTRFHLFLLLLKKSLFRPCGEAKQTT